MKGDALTIKVEKVGDRGQFTITYPESISSFVNTHVIIPLNEYPVFYIVFPKENEGGIYTIKGNFYLNLTASVLKRLILAYPSAQLDISDKILSSLPYTLMEIYEDCLSYLDYVWKTDIDYSKYTKIKLYPHQTIAIERALYQLGHGFFFEMRCGKTITSLVYASILHEKKLIKNVVVVAPLSALEGWKLEAETNLIYPNNFFNIRENHVENLEEKLNEDKLNIIIFNYEFWRSNRWEEFLNAMPKLSPFLMILDESHKVKDASTKAHRIYFSISEKARRTLLLSGTPYANSLEDLYSQGRFVRIQHLLGTTLKMFRERYMYKVNNFFWKPKRGSEKDILNKFSKYSVSVKQEDVFPRLEVQQVVHHYDITKQQRDYYDEIVNRISTNILDGKLSVSNALVESLKLMEICSGFLKVPDSDDIVVGSPFKEDLLRDIVDTYINQTQIVIWATFDYEVDKIAYILKKYRPIVIDGRVALQKRESLLNAFRTKKTRILISKPSVLGLGVDLSTARLAIFYSRDFSLINRDQAISRLLHPAKKGVVTIVDFVAVNTIEERVLSILKRKMDVSAALKDAASFVRFLSNNKVSIVKKK